MKRLTFLLAFLTVATFSCQDITSELAPENKQEIPEADLNRIADMGFSTEGVIPIKEGYLVEKDIYLSKADLAAEDDGVDLRIADVEHYSTRKIVKGLPRNITVSVDNSLSQNYFDAVALAIDEYNALGLDLSFSMVSSGGEIQIVGFYEGPSGGFITLGYAGFPSGKGDPYESISLNTHEYAYGENPNVQSLGLTIQHEMGHCIGFRHTDYMDRSYSCGSGGNEGRSRYGAVHIPGTPTGPDGGSWMLACAGSSTGFTANDIIALDYLY